MIQKKSHSSGLHMSSPSSSSPDTRLDTSSDHAIALAMSAQPTPISSHPSSVSEDLSGLENSTVLEYAMGTEKYKHFFERVSICRSAIKANLFDEKALTSMTALQADLTAFSETLSKALNKGELLVQQDINDEDIWYLICNMRSRRGKPSLVSEYLRMLISLMNAYKIGISSSIRYSKTKLNIRAQAQQPPAETVIAPPGEGHSASAAVGPKRTA